MSVLVSDRKESRTEAIVFAEELHDMLIELMQRSFGIKDMEQFVRMEYAHGKLGSEDVDYYCALMRNSKQRINQTASILTDNLRAARNLYPTSMEEYHIRRGYLDAGISNCEQLVNQLQHVVKIFNVNINIYGRHIKAINREIDLIKKWRQRDNKLKTYLQGNI